jgi:hypothetical protein
MAIDTIAMVSLAVLAILITSVIQLVRNYSD